MVLAKTLEKPLPKPTSEGYITTRLLEALVEARLALRFLEEGLVRNAAGKAFQSWRALMATLLRLELDKLKSLAKTEEERWLESTAVPRLPTGRMKTLSQMLEQVVNRPKLEEVETHVFKTRYRAVVVRKLKTNDVKLPWLDAVQRRQLFTQKLQRTPVIFGLNSRGHSGNFYKRLRILKRTEWSSAENVVVSTVPFRGRAAYRDRQPRSHSRI